jgi:sensor domain CHASE-containing protein
MSVIGRLTGRDRQHEVTVRRKTLAAIAITTILLILVLGTISRLFLVQRFADLEEARMAECVEQARIAIQDETVQLEKIAADNSVFDDAYRFMVSPSDAFLRGNFASGPNGNMARLNYQALAFIDTASRIVAAKGYNPATGLDIGISQGLTLHFLMQDKLIALPLAGTTVTGVFLVKEGPMLVSAQPILPSQGQGPVRGVLFMGSYLRRQDLDRIERKIKLTLSVGRLDDPHLASDFAFALHHLTSDSSVFVHPLDDGTIAGYTLFHDIYGTPVIILKAQMPRTIYRQGRLTLLYLVVALAIAGVAFGIVIELLLERLLVSRLSALGSSVREIAKSADPSSRVACEGNDELARFGEAINRMLASLELSQTEKRQAEDRYRAFMDNSPGTFTSMNRSRECFKLALSDCAVVESLT